MAHRTSNSKFHRFTTYSDFDSPVDPCKEEEACKLRSGLIFPRNQALHQQQYRIHPINSKPSGHLHANKPNTQHDNIHSEFCKKLYRCYLCREEYINKNALNKHISMRHLVSNRDIFDIVIPKWYCTKCKNEFSFKPKNNNEVTHFCANSIEKTDKIDSADSDIKLCSINNNQFDNDSSSNGALCIKRIRYECRVNNDLGSVEQWLKYELCSKQLARNDYLNAAKMFIGVQGYKIAIQLLKKSQVINHEIDSDLYQDDDMEQTLIDVAKKLMKQSK
eukprot:1092141_1